VAASRRASGNVDGSPQIDDEHHTRGGGGVVECAVRLAVVEHEDVIGSVVLNLQCITKFDVTQCYMLGGAHNTRKRTSPSTTSPHVPSVGISKHRWLRNT
jgi:hypothetical protein